MPMAQEHAFPEYMAWTRVLRGWARSQLGESGGSEEVTQGLQAAAQVSAWMFYPLWAGCLVETYLNEGNFDAAMNAVAEGRAVAARNEEHWFDA